MSITLVRSSFTPDLTHRTGYRSEEFNTSKFETFFCRHSDGKITLVVFDGTLWSGVFEQSLMEIMFHPESIKMHDDALRSLTYAEFIEAQ